MNNIFLPFVLTFLVSLPGFNQITESFVDNDFTQNPVWNGNISSYNVESGKLRSANFLVNSKYYLATSSVLVKNSSWSINVDLAFNPSSANFVDIFLTASDSNLLSTSQNGYFVRLGGTKDEICLYKKVNGTNTLLIDGPDGVLNKSSNSIKLTATCDQFYNWSLSYAENGNIFSAGTSIDSSITTSSWFGFAIAQSTASFFQRHYFDDIAVQTIQQDTVPPSLISAGFDNSKILILVFNEEIDTNWIKIKADFGLYDRYGKSLQIDKILFDSPEGLKIFLMDSISQGNYFLTLTDCKDRQGNINPKIIHSTLNYVPTSLAKYKDIIFTEFLVDPVPSIGLPEKEFIEIYNTANYAIELTGFTLSDPATNTKLPSYLLLPNSYLILCKSTDVGDFSPYGNTLGLNTMPSLNNSDDDIKLTSPQSILIDRANYSLAWYHNTQKDDGGYSLEIKDPTNLCLKNENWGASISPNGGTPGTQNSIYQLIRDTIPVSLQSINVSSVNTLKIIFSEEVDSSATVLSDFSLIPNLGSQSLIWNKDSLHALTIVLTQPISNNTEYQMTIKSVQDCSGNKNQLKGTFVLGDEALPGDILINELLFNPYPYGSDFVEIYNNSPRFIDLKGWMFANIKGDSIANKTSFVVSSFLLKPYEYLALTENDINILNTYPKAHADRVLKVKALPTFYDDIGNAILINSKNIVIDRFDYNESMHSPFITNKEGVSLEKINPSFSTQDASSWTSASKEVGFASPGYANSQFIYPNAIEDLVDIYPILITPNEDGDHDFMIIRLNSNKPGTLRNIQIFDITGRVIKHLERNNYSSTATQIQWDGDDDSNKLVPVGHYIIWLEVVNNEGLVQHFKRKVVVGERF